MILARLLVFQGILMLKRLYDWTFALAGRAHARWWLAAVAFMESSFFPIPPDILLIPMILARRLEAWLLAGIATLSSVAGALLGYIIGYFVYDAIAAPLIQFYGFEEQFTEFQALYFEYGAWIVAFFGVTPFPFKVITIASGATGLDLTVFMLACIGSRAIRYYLEAALLWKFGEPIRAFIEQHLGKVMLLGAVLLVGGFVALEYLI